VSVVIITLPLHRKRESQPQVSRCKSRRDRLHCWSRPVRQTRGADKSMDAKPLPHLRTK